jgi:dTDP-glucose 4,6-dehydratase
MRIVVVGGAGFIGSTACRFLVATRGATVLNIDRVGPTSSLASLAPIANSPRYTFRRADIADREHISALLDAFAPDAVVHAAAEHDASDRIGGAAAAVETNVVGTWRLLEAVREHWIRLPLHRRARFRFVSTSTGPSAASAASATRAAADEIVAGWHAAYGLPTIVARAADTFGPFQFPDAEIPSAVVAAICGEQAAVSETSPHSWLYAEDHARAIAAIIEKGVPGSAYAIAGRGVLQHSVLQDRIAELVERHGSRREDVARRLPQQIGGPSTTAPMATVRAVDADAAARLEMDTGWRPEETMDSALSKTVRWYLANEAWWRPLAAARTGGNEYGILRIA